MDGDFLSFNILSCSKAVKKIRFEHLIFDIYVYVHISYIKWLKIGNNQEYINNPLIIVQCSLHKITIYSFIN